MLPSKLTGCICLLLLGQVNLFAQAPVELAVEVPSGKFVGLPIHWNDQEGILLQRSGSFLNFEQRDVTDHQLLSSEFRPQALTEARTELQAELGAEFETTVAGPYVLAAPRGELQRWQACFTSLYASYNRYFDVRGWNLRQPDFPLCVIVFRNQAEYRGYAAYQLQGTAAQLPGNAVGSYLPQTNRCLLFNIPSAHGTDWDETQATIVHEAVHQIAYNTGLHERLFQNPLWIVEGLATMFEAPALYDPLAPSANVVQRMNAQKLEHFRQLAKNPEALQQMVESLIVGDDLFQMDSQSAYTVGWAMVFYLSERMPREFQTLLERIRWRRFGAYPAGERLSDYAQTIELHPSDLTTQMLRLYK